MIDEVCGMYRKVRVAIINSPLDTKYHSYGDHWVDGFQDAGCTVDVYGYKEIQTLPLDYDLYFFVEVRYNPHSIPWFITPRVLYSWDAHVLGTDYYKDFAHKFDTIYLASKIDVESLVEMGLENFKWLPEACNPRLHKNKGLERDVDIGFVGHGNSNRIRNGKTKDAFLGWLQHSKHKEALNHDSWGESYVDFMNKAKIAFDRVIAHNVGTRVFESAAMGCVPLWADIGVLEECGMSQLMEPGKHYVPYDDTTEGLDKVLDNLLSNPEKMEQIAKQAQEHVLANHTYAHRAKEVIKDHVTNLLEAEVVK